MADLVGPRLYSCCNCRNHVSLHDDIISKAFQGRHGRAFLFSHAMNIVVGAKEDRHLLTGLHTVADVHCGDCGEVLGWKYERAYEASQKYKEALDCIITPERVFLRPTLLNGLKNSRKILTQQK